MASSIADSLASSIMGSLLPSLLHVASFYLLIAALHVLLPAFTTTGYCCDFKTGKPLSYRLNGLPIVLATVWLATCALPPASVAFAAHHFWHCLCCANALGLAASFALLACFPEEASSCSEFLRHKKYLISPSVLRKAGIPYKTTIQRAGEAVITWPDCYHFGFNTGFNVAESTNFAFADWIPYGARCLRRYRSWPRGMCVEPTGDPRC